MIDRRAVPLSGVSTPSIDALTGSDRVRLAIDADRLASLLADWDRAAAQFRASQAGYLLYS